MDEDQQYEHLSMDADYEGGQFIGGEFYYQRRTERRHQSKDDAIYGSFIDADSDSDDGGSRKRRRGDLISEKADLTKPVQFVSTGTVMPSQEIERNLEEIEAAAALETNQGQGLGFGGDPGKKEGGEDDEDFLPTAFGRKIKEGAQRRVKEREKLRSMKKIPGRRDAGGAMQDVGKFESHTKGIGLKLMEKMGYKFGGGLGKNEQGIVAPIEAKLRPKNMGMGFNDYKEAKLPALDETLEEKSVAPAVVGRPKEKRWLKNKQGKKKAEYMTAEELLAKKQEQGLEVVQKVLDMRGPQVRVLVNLESLNAEEEAKENQVPMPELQHNVRLLVDLAEADVQKLDRDLRRGREKVASLHSEKEKLQKEAARQKQQLEVMETIAEILGRTEDESLSGSLTLDSLLKIFSGLKDRFEDDYKLCNLSCIACSYAYPLLIRVFQGWEPLQNPLHGVQLMSSWRDLLQEGQPYDYSDSVLAALPYTQLVSEVVLPAVRISGTNTWQARDPEPMLRFLESWDRLLPPPVLQSILEHVIMPKLSSAVELWDPRRETVPIHVWIHPWLPLLGQRLDVLYHTIRFKLGNVLHAWHASDSSAYAILSPWKDVFDAASWEQLIVRYIVPKLMSALEEFQINPANQILDQFNWVMMWASAIPIHHMVTLLEVQFFHKWKEVLYRWLLSNPDYNEVMRWYLGWKGLFPPELLANEQIRKRLTEGLDMMNQAVEGVEVVQPGAREHVSYLRVTEKRHFEAQQQAAGYASYQHPPVSGNGYHMDATENAPQMSFKEMIEAYAAEQGLVFIPRVGRSYNGLPVYGFGNVSICIDSVKQLLFAQTQEGWGAVSLKQLLEMHHRVGRH
ncbi:Septin and tuftelin interacting protein [Dioscorea alata]|uniref:Septin and tuftelin interacting protein n=1 Tax=Dioscorea alata TaxID=55571 RepID=A0ACB7UL32_DIOAL|nr:Septin and tuftelin interacting protein [Dioscorea alata]